jgi:hypothetical protein
MIEIYKLEQAAGEDQLIVAFVNRDESSQIDVQAMLAEVGRDAAERERDGLRLISVGGLPMRQTGTAGNVLFQSGGQFATQVAVVAVYARDRGARGAG